MGTKTAILKDKPATKEVSPQDICNFILSYCKEAEIEVPHMKLHKLLFYCHAWYLVHFNKPLIKDGFQAWVHGPVNVKMWKKYKKFWPDNIPLDNVPDPTDKLSDEVYCSALSVLEQYSGYTSEELSKLSHLEDPWIKTRGRLPAYELCDKVIPDQEIRQYYGKRVGL